MKKSLLFPIRAVSKQTGISIETLRAWERRYQVVTPQRGERGRLFTETDVQHLRLLRQAVEQGHAIGQLAPLTSEELRSLLVLTGPTVVATPASKPTEPRSLVLSTLHSMDLGKLMAAIERLDYAEVERELALLAAVLPPRELVHQVALPLLQQVGEAWHAGQLTIAQEHMTSALLRNLLGAIVPLHHRAAPPAKLLFATPTREQHEFGILLSAMLAAGGGLGIVYLGTNLPGEEIVRAAHQAVPQAIVLGLIGANGARASVTEIQAIAQRLPAQIELWVGGAKDQDVMREIKQTRALWLDDFDMLEQHLIRLGARF
jgi:DNA-binding transcriptional MerR regulator/methylmalonyl-CoA mutase cobalamin-binding subunit